MAIENLGIDKVALVFALVEVIKSIDNEKKLEKYYPVFSLVMGIILSGLLAYPDTFDIWVKVLLNGLVFGLSASGFYSQAKAIKSR